MNIYEDHGYRDRRDYLECLAEEYDLSIYTVLELATILGRDEDLDGLVSALKDLSEGG